MTSNPTKSTQTKHLYPRWNFDVSRLRWKRWSILHRPKAITATRHFFSFQSKHRPIYCIGYLRMLYIEVLLCWLEMCGSSCVGMYTNMTVERSFFQWSGTPPIVVPEACCSWGLLFLSACGFKFLNRIRFQVLENLLCHIPALMIGWVCGWVCIKGIPDALYTKPMEETKNKRNNAKTSKIIARDRKTCQLTVTWQAPPIETPETTTITSQVAG